MIHKKKRLVPGVCLGLAFAGLVFLLAGCGGGLPKDLKNQARAIPDAIKTGSDRVDSQKDRYERLTRSVEFKTVKPFATKENWDQKFQQAHSTLDRAKKLYETDLAPLVSKGRPETVPQIQQQIVRINKVLTEAEDIARYPADRFARIRTTIQTADRIKHQAQKDAGDIDKIVTALKTGAMAKASTDFPDLSEKLNTRFAPIAELGSQSRAHLGIIETEYGRHTAGQAADYAAFTDSAQALSSSREQARTLETRFTRDTAQLYSSYTKILKDMKEEYYVTVKRESWDENSDYYNPKFATFQRQVDAETYEALTADNIDAIATISAGFTGSRFSSNVGGLWKKLSINPGEGWPGRNHNAASFWVEDAKERYFHKYLLEENGETRETDWEQVNASFYDANLDYLGMAILSKPYGVFEQDQLTQPAPPGMAYVGNDRYGEWKKDSQGNSFWSWYGKYALFSTLFGMRPSYYGYNSWNSWNTGYRGNRPYFGQTRNGFQKYGTAGTAVKQSPGFQSSNFAKSGGFKSQTASVRGAGAGLRGGGPKSKGK